MKRSDFKIGFSKFTYMILHTTKQRTPVPTGVQTVDKALRESMFLGAFFYHYKDVWV